MADLGESLLVLLAVVLLLGFCWRWYASSFSALPGGLRRASRGGSGGLILLLLSVALWIAKTLLVVAVQVFGVLIFQVLVPVAIAVGQALGGAWTNQLAERAGRAHQRQRAWEDEHFRRWERDHF